MYNSCISSWKRGTTKCKFSPWKVIILEMECKSGCHERKNLHQFNGHLQHWTEAETKSDSQVESLIGTISEYPATEKYLLVSIILMRVINERFEIRMSKFHTHIRASNDPFKSSNKFLSWIPCIHYEMLAYWNEFYS